jgi:PAS domain S-box-containing protein
MTDPAAVFAAAFEHAREAFYAVDAGGAIAAWNPAAERLYGYTAAEALGRPVALLDFPAERDGLAGAALSPAAGGRGPRERIQRQRHKSGRELRIALWLVPLVPLVPGGAASERPGTLVCALDVSRRQRAEEDLTASRAALAASRTELRQFAGRVVASEEEARRRIARELHDDLCQRLAALALEVKAARQRLPGGDPTAGWGTVLDTLGSGLAALGEDLRRLSHDLHPAMLERLGLAEALRDQCADCERRYGLAVKLSLRDAERPFPPEVALGLYRIGQEALANAARHARARTVHVTLMTAASAAYLSVADDGAGFDPGEARESHGLGLASVEERARMLGGRCRIASAPGAGAEIAVTVPLPAPEPAVPEPREAGAGPPPRHVGPYQLLEEIRGGGTATVYLAREPEPLGRLVALELHRKPLAGRRETLRFKAERQALARLRHPAIAQVYEARTTDDGDLYIVTEHVPGMPITEYCDRYGLDVGRRLALFAVVCDGVRHAHQKGVLHRDLRPANILVMEEAGVALPKIIDFGAAEALDWPLGEGASWSAERSAGNAAYRAPEALGGSAEVDARSDVYALGVVLYELLAGTVPVGTGEGEGTEIGGPEPALHRRGAVPPSRCLRALRTVDPAAAAAVARRRRCSDVRQLVRRLAGDLDRVASTALTNDPAARYSTVDALGRDVGCVLRGEPIEAGPPGAVHQLGRLVRRHRPLVASAAVVILALTGGLVAASLEARRAEQEAVRADAAAGFLEELFRASDPRQARGETPDARELLRRGAVRLRGQLRGQPLVRARLLDTLGGVYTDLGLFDEARPLLLEALEIRERLRGSGHPEVAATLVRLGALAHLSGHGDAVSLFRRALALREAYFGPEHPEVADVLNKLGAALAAQGRYDEAEATLRRALALGERLWGARDPRVAKVLHNLSGIAYYRGRAADAERLLERALAIREATLARDDPDLAGSFEALALVRQRQGRVAEAAALLERQLATAEKIYGAEHPEVARVLLNLGLARADLGEDDDARRLMERALAMAERTLKAGQPLLARSLGSLADHHFKHGRFAAAEPLYRRFMAQQAGGSVDPERETALGNWARLLRATGRDAEAARVEAAASARGARRGLLDAPQEMSTSRAGESRASGAARHP